MTKEAILAPTLTENPKPVARVRCAQDNFVALAAGKLSGMSAYMSGKMKLKGKVPLAQKFGDLAAAARKAGKKAAAAKPAASAAAPAPAAAAGADGSIGGALPAGFASNAVFQTIAANMAAEPALLKKVNGRLLFKVSGGAGGSTVATWTVDATVGAGTVSASEPAAGTKADVTITIGDADLLLLASGKLNAMAAYMGGKLKLSGKVALAQKLAALLGSGKPHSKL